MSRTLCRLMSIPLFTAFMGCGDGAPGEPVVVENSASAGVDTAAADSQTSTGALTGAEGMPLRAIMNGLSVDMAGLSQALWVEDYAALAERANAVANHPDISATEISRIQNTLGPEMEAFEEVDEEVHLASLRMLEAAEARDLEAIMQARDEVQRGCVSCHTRFRDRLRTVQP